MAGKLSSRRSLVDRHWLACCLLLLLLANACHCSPPAETEIGKSGFSALYQTTVYRGDVRPPELLREQGGFLPSSWMSTYDDQQYSIHHHVYGTLSTAIGVTRHRSNYVATSSNIEVAAHFINIKSIVRAAQGPPDQVAGYIYHIRPTRNFIGVTETLTEKYNSLYAWEKEFAALGGIRWSQVMGWSVLPKDYRSHPSKLDFITNKDYERILDGSTTSRSVPTLAGFPSDHEAMSKEPWKTLAKQDNLEGHALTFMNRLGSSREDTRWHGSFPLFERASTIAEIVRNIEKLGDKAEAAWRSAVRAPSNIEEEPFSLELATGALRAQLDALKETRHLLRLLESHPYLDIAHLDEGWKHVIRAVDYATRARWQAELVHLKEYAAQIGEFREAAEKPGAQAKGKLLADATKAEEGLRKFTALRRTFRQKVAMRIESLEVERARMQIYERAGSEMPRYLNDRLFWSKYKETRQDGLRRQIARFNSELRACQWAESALIAESSKVKSDVKASWAAMARAVAEKLDEQSAQGSLGASQTQTIDVNEIASEILIAILLSAPRLLGASALGGPVGATVALGLEAPRLVKWLGRAWKAVKLANRILSARSGTKVADTDKLAHLTRQAEMEMERYEIPHGSEGPWSSVDNMRDLARELDETPRQASSVAGTTPSDPLQAVLDKANKVQASVIPEAMPTFKDQEVALQNVDKAQALSYKGDAQTAEKEIEDALASLPEIPKDLPGKSTLPELPEVPKDLPGKSTLPELAEVPGHIAGSKPAPAHETLHGKRDELRPFSSAQGVDTEVETCDNTKGGNLLMDRNLDRLDASLNGNKSSDGQESTWDFVQRKLTSKRINCE